MAKKKTASKPLTTWRYKNKSSYGGGKIHNNWLECTDEGKAKLEQMFKGKFVFQAIEPPEPTPSMKARKGS